MRERAISALGSVLLVSSCFSLAELTSTERLAHFAQHAVVGGGSLILGAEMVGESKGWASTAFLFGIVAEADFGTSALLSRFAQGKRKQLGSNAISSVATSVGAFVGGVLGYELGGYLCNNKSNKDREIAAKCGAIIGIFIGAGLAGTASDIVLEKYYGADDQAADAISRLQAMQEQKRAEQKS